MGELYWRGFNYSSRGIAYEPFWEAKGDYISRSYVRSGVQSLQHLSPGYEGLMIGACGPGELETDDYRQYINELIEEKVKLRREAVEARMKEQEEEREADGRDRDWDMLPELDFDKVESALSEPTDAPTQGDADVTTAIDERPIEKRLYQARCDFKPREEDELEVRTGRLVSVLSIYDPGWVSNPPSCIQTVS
jgi:hypothetical protein